MVPERTSAETRWLACWPEPHCVSTVVPPVRQPLPRESQALRARLLDCSPAWVTQPPMICSTSRGVDARRASTTASCTFASSCAGWNAESAPLTDLAARDRRAQGFDDDGFAHLLLLRVSLIFPRIMALVGTPTPAVTSTWSFFFGWFTRGAADQPHALVHAVHAVDVGLA